MIENNIHLIYYISANKHRYKLYENLRSYFTTTHYLYNKDNEKEWIKERYSFFERPFGRKIKN